MTEKRYDCEICKHKGICKVINILERNKEVRCPLITSNWGGLIMTEKTNIDDIIGIVKTGEKTDSVELKKEYYKNQSKDKHYTYLNYSKDGYIGSFYENDKPLTNKEVWDLLNEQEERIQELEKENKQLKIEVLGQSEEIEILSDENKRLKQSKYVYGIHGGSND